MKNRTMRILTLVWAAVLIAMVSSTVTLLAVGRGAPSRWVSREEYDALQRYARLDEVRDKLMTDYYRELDEDALMLGAIRGMTAAVGDIYTFYYTPEEMTRARQNDEGEYQGLGTLIQRSPEGYIRIVLVYPDTPAEAAGLRAGDVITAVDGVKIDGDDGKSYSDAVNRMRGEEDTTVRLSVLREGETLEFEVARGSVNVSYANWTMLDDGIGYVSVSQFTGNASQRFAQALEDFKRQGARGMVIDLRNNPGGLLDQVLDMADSILPKGLIVYIQGRDGVRKDFYSDEAHYDIPLVVLVNGMSASASEIMAASVQCFDRGAVIGTTTYGKGIVQTLLTFPEDGAGMQLTTSSYYDGNGRSIHGTGVEPDVTVEAEGVQTPLTLDPENDNQLSEALRVLEQEIAQAQQGPQDS